jgi:hypothetical protein
MLRREGADCEKAAFGSSVGYVKVQVPSSEAEGLLERIESERRRRRAETADPEGDGWPHSDDLACGTEISEDEHRCPTCGWSYADGRE